MANTYQPYDQQYRRVDLHLTEQWAPPSALPIVPMATDVPLSVSQTRAERDPPLDQGANTPRGYHAAVAASKFASQADRSAIHINAAASVGNPSTERKPVAGVISTLKVLNPSRTSSYSAMPQYGAEPVGIHPCRPDQTGTLNVPRTHRQRARRGAVKREAYWEPCAVINMASYSCKAMYCPDPLPMFKQSPA